MRIEIPQVIEQYRKILQRGIADEKMDEHTLNSLKKRLARLEELERKWRSAWNRSLIDQGRTPGERDEIMDAVYQAEKQFATECPNIFRRSYYFE